jgi:glutaredoxin
MEFELPLQEGFTIYSKSGCPNCINVKKILQEDNIEYLIIDCDEYLIEERENFLKFIQNLTGKEWKLFPIVFFDNIFLGGFKETKEYIDKKYISFDAF